MFYEIAGDTGMKKRCARTVLAHWVAAHEMICCFRVKMFYKL